MRLRRDFNTPRVVKCRSITWRAALGGVYHKLQERSCCSHSTYVFPLWPGRISNHEQSCKVLSIWKPSHGHLEARTLTRNKGHKLESMLLTMERQTLLHTSQSFWIVRLANPMSPLSCSLTKNFTCSAALHVVHLGLRNTPCH